MLIILCLLPLIAIAFLSVFFGSEFISILVETGMMDDLKVNGTTPEWSVLTGLSSPSGTFGISAIEGAIAIIIIIAVISIGLGIQVLGSGLSETTVKLMTSALAYTGIWILLSLLANPLLFSIETFGSIIYMALTLGYTIGVIQHITGN